MRILTAITRSAWLTGMRTVPCAHPTCRRWLTRRALDSRRVGITLGDAWFCSYRCLIPKLESFLRGLLLAPSLQSEPVPRMPLGPLLVSRGQLGASDLRQVLTQEGEEQLDLGERLVELGYVTEQQATSARAAQWGCPVFSIRTSTSPILVPVPTLILAAFNMTPMHVFETGRRVLLGFARRVEYGALHAVEKQTGCRTQACVIAPTELSERLRLQSTLDHSICVNQVESTLQMVRTICNEGAAMGADQLSVVRCGAFLWARLRSGGTVRDVLLRVGERNFNRYLFESDRSIASLAAD